MLANPPGLSFVAKRGRWTLSLAFPFPTMLPLPRRTVHWTLRSSFVEDALPTIDTGWIVVAEDRMLTRLGMHWRVVCDDQWSQQSPSSG